MTSERLCAGQPSARAPRTALQNEGPVFPPQGTSEGTACDHTVDASKLSPNPKTFAASFTRRYFFSVTQTRSIGFLPMFRDWCPTLISIVGIQPTSPSGEGLGYGRSGSWYVFADHWPPLM
jgi:hypothetical protein